MSIETLLEGRRSLSRARRRILPSRYLNTEHTYQALPAWSEDGTQLLYIGFDDTRSCDVVVRDVASGDERAIARTELFDFHTAAWQHWAVGDRAVLYRGQDQNDLTPPSLVSVEAPHRAEPVPALSGCLVRQMIEHGRKAVYYRWPQKDRLAEAGIHDLESGATRVLFGVEEALNGLTVGSKPRPEDVEFHHVVANPSGTRVFFKIQECQVGKTASVSRSFHAFDLTTEKFIDFGGAISGHPVWIDDRYIVNVQSPRDGSDGRWLVAMDAESGVVHRLIDLCIEGPGHPAVSPDGRWMVTDAFTADEKQAILYLVDLTTLSIREIDRFDHPRKSEPGYNPHVISRAHPHPTWSPDSTSLLGNCILDGERLGLVVWDGFFN